MPCIAIGGKAVEGDQVVGEAVRDRQCEAGGGSLEHRACGFPAWPSRSSNDGISSDLGSRVQLKLWLQHQLTNKAWEQRQQGG